MTKILLSGFFLLFISLSAEACKPAPLSRPECSAPSVKVDYKAYLKLLKGIQNYQKRLSGGIIRPQGTHSCFDNHFAVHYGLEFKRFMDDNKRLACRQQLEVVKRSFIDLISLDSEEFRAVRNVGYQKDLRERAVKIEAEIKALFGI